MTIEKAIADVLSIGGELPGSSFVAYYDALAALLSIEEELPGIPIAAYLEGQPDTNAERPYYEAKGQTAMAVIATFIQKDDHVVLVCEGGALIAGTVEKITLGHKIIIDVPGIKVSLLASGNKITARYCISTLANQRIPLVSILINHPDFRKFISLPQQ